MHKAPPLCPPVCRDTYYYYLFLPLSRYEDNMVSPSTPAVAVTANHMHVYRYTPVQQAHRYIMLAGMIDLREDNVESLLSTACLLQLGEVKDACCSFLVKQLHPSNCIGIRQFADAQGCTYLYTVANSYVMVSTLAQGYTG